MKLLLFAISLALFPFTLVAQEAKSPMSRTAVKKQLDHEDFAIWNTIRNVQISDNGQWIIYVLEPHEGNKTLHVYNAVNKKTLRFNNVENPVLDKSGEHVVFKTVLTEEKRKILKRKKTKTDDMPLDTLSIYNLADQKLLKIPHLKKFSLGKKWGGHLCYMLEDEKVEADSLAEEKMTKPQGDKNGYHLIIRDLSSTLEDTISYVETFSLAEKSANILLHKKGGAEKKEGLFYYNIVDRKLHTVNMGKAVYSSLHLSEDGSQAAYLMDSDTTKTKIRPHELYYWNPRLAKPKLVAGPTKNLKNGWKVSKHRKPYFSKNGARLFYGTAPKPMLRDTNLLAEDEVQVEIWNYKDQRLYTQQEVEAKRDKEKSYLSVYNIATNGNYQLADLHIDQVFVGDEGNATTGIGTHQESYMKTLSWDGNYLRDVYTVDLRSGKKNRILDKINGYPRISPGANYVYWYSRSDTSWMAYHLEKEKQIILSKYIDTPIYDEINDRPTHPGSNGSMGWTENDEHFLVYDRYDIWKVNPNKPRKPIKLTNSRAQKQSYRYVRLDPEERYIDATKKNLVRFFNEDSKKEGFAYLDIQNASVSTILEKPMAMGRRPIKAKNHAHVIYTEENFNTFPNLILTDTEFSFAEKISDANPQQKDYSWGSIELYDWKDEKGNSYTGMLVKPEGFSATKKYPMIVNFYEKSSNGVNRHRAPYPHRSTINYSFYASRGYVIFNPDIYYTNGYPGRSAEEAVISGTKSLIEKGFIDKDKVGIQGHSWGGYQIAHIITKTDMFACAESGAPVVNMVSAYGGIRWGSGMSRMFQYEHTQSRIGATLWENPDLYLENSPIFNVNKINTPVLILHNDEDGAVPWYQGIEFFVAMRRLNKPAWMLNYNGEPHWPVKKQNRKDFNKRMQQFFDHYLLDAPEPVWMKEGVPAIEQGMNLGLELDKN